MAKKTNSGCAEGDMYLDKAEKKLNSLFSFGGNKWVEGLQLYERAISAYKLNNNYKEAAQALKNTVQIHLKNGNKAKAAGAYAEAATYFAKAGEDTIPDAQECLNKAIDMYVDEGKFQRAAALQEEMGELLEEEGDGIYAIYHYQKAADYYEADNQMGRVPKCLLKVAELSAQAEKYHEAAVIFEQMAKGFLKDKMLRPKARPMYISAFLCRLAKILMRESKSNAPLIDGEEEGEGELLGIDMEPIRDQLSEYYDQDYTLKDSHEGKLLEGILKSIEQRKIKDFEAALRKYDQQYKKFDDWTTTLLLRIKSDAEKSWSIGDSLI